MKRTATAVKFAVAISVVVFLAHANAQPSIAAIGTRCAPPSSAATYPAS